MNEEKMSLKRSLSLFNKAHSAKQGVFPAIVTVLVIVLVIAFNMVVGQLPTTVSQFDLSDNKLYQVSDVSIEYLKTLDKDVDVIVLYLKDKVDGRITKFIDTYAEYSDRIHVQYVDPIAYPSLLTTYSAESGDVVVRCQETGRYQTFSLTDVIEVDYYLYYVLNQYVEASFDCEALLTAAVNYVVEEGNKTVYLTSGHGEAALGETVETLLSRNRCTTAQINLLVSGKVPEDCEILLINNPSSDLNADELDALERYLDAGGQVVFFPSSSINALPRWDAFLARYGLRTTDNYVMEFENQYGSNNYAFFPLVSLDADVSRNLTETSTILLQNAKGLLLDNSAILSGWQAESFMATSSSAAVLSPGGSYEQGNFLLGVVVRGEGGGRLTVISAPSMIDEELLDAYNGIDNQQLFLDVLLVSLGDTTRTFSIEPISLITQQNNVHAGRFWSLIYIAFIPAIVVVLGFFNWLLRRRR